MTETMYQEMIDAVAECPVKLDEIDLFKAGQQEHWFDSYRILHEEAPILRIPGEGTTPGTDGFIVTKYEDIAMIIRDPYTFPQPSYGGAGLEVEEEDEHSVLLDAMSRNTLRPNMELHKQHRIQLTDPWVGATGAPRHRPMVTRFVDELIDDWIDRQPSEIDFVEEFAAPLPQMVMTTILGFPFEDMPQLRIWGQAQVRRFVYGKGHRNLMSPEEEAENARDLGDFMRYVQSHVTKKRQDPQDDMTSFLTQVEYMGRKLTDSEVVGVVFGMHIGGLETTQYAIAAEAELLAREPELWNTIKADRSKIRFFVEEGMRIQAPTQGLSTRMTARDIEMRGVKIPQGSILHLRYGAANLDAEEFGCPADVDLTRPNTGRHMTFSQGIRVCPGAGISRLEQNIAWERLTQRLETLEVAPGNDFRHQPGIMLGLWKLDLKFTKAANQEA
jgi:cytochrome P450